MTLRIANAQGFWGDRPDAAATLLKQSSGIDIITMDYLAEVSLSIMAIQREKDPTLGYARDFVEVVRSLIPFWKTGSRVKLVSNAGGLNPSGCADACRTLLNSEGCQSIKISVIDGDDVLEQLLISPEKPAYSNLESGDAFNVITKNVVTANAYIGAEKVTESLINDADIVIAGRVADPSLVVGCAAAHYGWSLEDYDKLANATVSGHLIECGTQVTGGFSTDWMELPDLANIGFPIIEVAEDGSCIVTKAPETGGAVTERTVKEQLLYEIGDPNNYLSPDCTASFLGITVEDLGNDRVRVSGATGRPPSSSYKVSATYRDGFRADGMLAIVGADAERKAQRCGEIILERLETVGSCPQRSVIEVIGAGGTVPGVLPCPQGLRDCVLHIAVADADRERVVRFTKEIAPLVTSGPQGVTGYATGRPKVRPVFGYWPCLIPRDQVLARVSIG